MLFLWLAYRENGKQDGWNMLCDIFACVLYWLEFHALQICFKFVQVQVSTVVVLKERFELFKKICKIEFSFKKKPTQTYSEDDEY